jgi:hypothetical protein
MATKAVSVVRRIAVFATAVLLGTITPSFSAACQTGGGLMVRQTGKPAPDTVLVSVAQASGQFTLRLHNGPPGYDRVSAADVWLNGVQVFRESDFSQQVEWL